MSPSLHGRTAIVTGASSGLGERFARVLHGAGATVVVAARRPDRLAALGRELGPRLVAHPCDLAVDEQRVALVERTIADVGRVDILVNNAGTGTPRPAEEEALDDFRHTLELNLVALFHLSQLAGRDMLQRGQGAIVNVASMFGLVASAPIPHAGYCASKGGVIALTRELGSQWASRGVRVNALAPGWFESEMTADMWTDDRSMAHVRRGAPLGRHGRAHELDGALLLLAGDDGSYITGQTITVDGGWTAR